ncbi:hypothetical protein A2U01_0064218 [Trifolium medium]|uniref:Uncharacterized protein n=1 Tax=Trifolium medium TaxID=97028 RepID=A0A392S259_9FABA|nr:hypothetical protein [Trifolium medium]
MNNVSSAYWRCEMETSPSFTTKGLKNLNSTALDMRDPSPSATNKNKKEPKDRIALIPYLYTLLVLDSR